MTKFICIYDGSSGEGETLEEAYDSLTDTYGEPEFNETNFYEVKPINVERKIIIKQVTVIGKAKS